MIISKHIIKCNASSNKNPEALSRSSSKISYLISEAVGLYFNTLNVEDVKKSSSSFNIHYDETTHKQVKKQLETEIRFWSETDSAFKVHHLKTYLTRHSTDVCLVKNCYLLLKARSQVSDKFWQLKAL